MTFVKSWTLKIPALFSLEKYRLKSCSALYQEVLCFVYETTSSMTVHKSSLCFILMQRENLTVCLARNVWYFVFLSVWIVCSVSFFKKKSFKVSLDLGLEIFYLKCCLKKKILTMSSLLILAVARQALAQVGLWERRFHSPPVPPHPYPPDSTISFLGSFDCLLTQLCLQCLETGGGAASRPKLLIPSLRTVNSY